MEAGKERFFIRLSLISLLLISALPIYLLFLTFSHNSPDPFALIVALLICYPTVLIFSGICYKQVSIKTKRVRIVFKTLLIINILLVILALIYPIAIMFMRVLPPL